MLDDLLKGMAGAGPGDGPGLAQPDAVTIAASLEDELGGLAPHGESGAPERVSAEALGEDGPEFFPAHHGCAFPIENDAHGPVALVALDHGDAVEARADVGPDILVQRVP